MAEALAPLRADPGRAAVFLDIDGVLAPIVERAEDAHVPEATSRLLAAIARRYGCMACISGRAAAEARRLVGVGAIVYAGSHGAELLDAGANSAAMAPAVAERAEQVRAFAAERDRKDLRVLRVRMEDKGAIFAFHWRGAPDEPAAKRLVEQVAEEAEAAGLHVHWGRKVLEVRPPVEISKGQAVLTLVARCASRTAVFAGDDATDLDAFDALDRLVSEGRLDGRVLVGVRSDEGPAAIVERADVVVDGPEGFAEVLAALAEDEA
jgi:trehalose 6-phosphate phosphatase